MLVETPTNFNYNSLKAECCSDEDVLAVLSADFLKTTKVLECLECLRTFYKMKADGPAPPGIRPWDEVALDFVLDIILTLAFCN